MVWCLTRHWRVFMVWFLVTLRDKFTFKSQINGRWHRTPHGHTQWYLGHKKCFRINNIRSAHFFSSSLRCTSECSRQIIGKLNIVAHMLACLLNILQVPGSNLGPKAAYRNWGSSFFSGPPYKCPDSVLKLATGASFHTLPNLYVYKSSCQSNQHNVAK